MGYDIHITRRQSWADTGAPEITLAEWQAIVDSDPELTSASAAAKEFLAAMKPVMMFDPSCNALHIVPFDEWQVIAKKDPAPDAADHDSVGTGPDEYALMFHPSRRYFRVFHYSDGSIFVTKPGKAVLMKMLEVAHKLNARVIGEADEIYAADGTPSHETYFTGYDDW